METKRLLLWFVTTEHKPGAKAIFNSVLLPLQLCLGLWLIVKLTPLWALINCTKSWLMMKIFPWMSCACSDYKQLKRFKGRVFKRVICYVTTPGVLPTVSALKEVEKGENKVYEVQVKQKDCKEVDKEVDEVLYAVQVNQKDSEKKEKAVQIKYLDKIFQLKRKEINVCGDDVPKYYVTDVIWGSIQNLRDHVAADGDLTAKEIVFIKNHREIWEEVVTGRVMSFEEVLDAVILDGQTVTRLDHEYFMPVDLTISEEKILKVLNLVGLFLQKQKHIYWLIPALFSLTAAVMGFSTTLRRWVYRGINMLSCYTIHFVCDRLSFSTRRYMYSLGNWIENLKPSNDLQARIVRGDITALIAGGAKINICGTTLDPIRSTSSKVYKFEENNSTENSFDTLKKFKCGTFDIECKFEQNKDTQAEFEQNKDAEAGEAQNIGKCTLKAGEVATVDINSCSRSQAEKLFQFAAHMAKYRSGSLKSYKPNSKTGCIRRFRESETVCVRRVRESVNAYVRSGFPPLYELKLKNVVVR